jgi:hypothetical protein
MDLRPRLEAVATLEPEPHMQGQQLPGGFARRVIGVAQGSVFGIFASPISPLCLDSWEARVVETRLSSRSASEFSRFRISHAHIFPAT